MANSALTPNTKHTLFQIPDRYANMSILTAPPSPETDPLKGPSSVNEHMIPLLRKVLTDEKRVLAGFIPSDEPDHPTLKMFVLHQDKELKTQ